MKDLRVACHIFVKICTMLNKKLQALRMAYCVTPFNRLIAYLHWRVKSMTCSRTDAVASKLFPLDLAVCVGEGGTVQRSPLSKGTNIPFPGVCLHGARGGGGLQVHVKSHHGIRSQKGVRILWLPMLPNPHSPSWICPSLTPVASPFHPFVDKCAIYGKMDA